MLDIVMIKMGFNGIAGNLSEPGIIPWPIVAIYFALASLFLFYIARKNGSLSRFKTVDYVYVGIGAAFMIVWNFFVGPFLDKFVPSGAASFIGFGSLGQFVILLIVIGVVRKVGVGMLGWAIYDILADIYSYGFGGEPIYLIYKMFAFGIIMDLWIAATRGKPFGIGSGKIPKASDTNVGAKAPAGSSGFVSASGASAGTGSFLSKPKIIPVIAGIVMGIPYAIAGPIFFTGFFAPLLYGGIVDWQAIIFSMYASLPSFLIFGIIGSLIAARVSKVLG